MLKIETQIMLIYASLLAVGCMVASAGHDDPCSGTPNDQTDEVPCVWSFEDADFYEGDVAATSGICTADFNGDGWLDVAIANRGTDDVCVFVNDGTGHFTLHSCVDIGFESTPRYVVAGDWDGDGDMDAATSNWNAQEEWDGEYDGGSVTVLLNDGTGTLTLASEHLLLRASSLDIGDLNGDGNLDIVATHWDPATGSGGPGFATVLMNNGDGTFTEVAQILVGNLPRGVAIGDLDGDGDLDLAASNMGSDDSVTIIENLGDFQFVVHEPLECGSTPRYLAIGDIDGDGLNDIAVVHKVPNTLLIYRNIGGMEFLLFRVHPTADNPHSVCIEDLNDDCLLDVVVSHVGDNVINIYKNIGLGALELELELESLHGPAHVIAADVNEDGKPDLLTACVNGGWFNVHISEVLQIGCCFGDIDNDGFVGVSDLLFLISDWGSDSDTLCISDLDGDGIVDVNDLLLMISLQWGPCSACVGDFDGDGIVGVKDLLTLFNVWGSCSDCAEDIDGDGIVGVKDFLALISAWGPCID